MELINRRQPEPVEPTEYYLPRQKWRGILKASSKLIKVGFDDVFNWRIYADKWFRSTEYSG